LGDFQERFGIISLTGTKKKDTPEILLIEAPLYCSSPLWCAPRFIIPYLEVEKREDEKPKKKMCAGRKKRYTPKKG